MHILVRIEKKIIPIKPLVNKQQVEEALKTKKSNEYVVAYSSLEDGMIQIEHHNNIVSGKVAPVRKKNQPQSKEANQDASIITWDYDKITSRQWKRVIKHYEAGENLKVFKMHNEGKWSPVNYCCDGFGHHVLINLKRAYSAGVISNENYA